MPGNTVESRTKHTYRTNLYAFVRDILVVCPSCAGKAVVHTGEFNTMKHERNAVRIVCSSCGYNKGLDNLSHRQDPKQKQGAVLKFGAPIDPFFHLPVWLQADFSGETLWAYNHEHLDFLAQHVGAKLRERNGFTFNVKSIGARLPRWMTAANNREAVLKAIEKLREK
ncbi:MAG: TFIIB-type zinc ribbon-containing protein [Saprospiraceae bacterium]